MNKKRLGILILSGLHGLTLNQVLNLGPDETINIKIPWWYYVITFILLLISLMFIFSTDYLAGFFVTIIATTFLVFGMAYFPYAIVSKKTGKEQNDESKEIS